MLAGPAPEVLIGPIASATERIRVGSGGVMLPHYSPLKVAESFSLLSGLFPGRIDLGLGRASGTDPITAQVLQRDRRQAAAGRLLRAARRADRLPRGPLPGRPPAEAADGAARPARVARAVAARLLAAERDLGRRPRPAVRVRRLHQLRRRRRHRAAVPRALRGLRAARRRRAPRSRCWTIAADTDEEAQRLAYSLADGDDDAAPRPADPGPAGREGRALPQGRGAARQAARPPARARHAATPSAPGSRRSRASTAPRR